MLSQRLISHPCQHILGFWAGEQFFPLTLRLQFSQDEAGEFVLIFHWKLRSSLEGSLKKGGHLYTSLPSLWMRF